MKKKFIAPLLVIPMLASTLASCGGAKKNNFAYDLDFNVDVKGTTIEFWAGFGSDLTNKIEELCDEFQRLTGVKVKFESKSDYDSCLKAVTLAGTSGSYPHVVVGYPDHFASYVKSDIIVRLDYYLENDVHNPTFEPEGETFKLSDFYDDYVTENQSIEFDKDGNPYTLGIPFNKSSEILIYNKTFFDYCASIESLADKIYVPATYDELEEVGLNILKYLDENDLYGKQLIDTYSDGGQVKEKVILDLTGITKADGKNSTTQFKPFSYDSQANLFITTVRQNGGTYTEFDKKAKKGYLAFNSQETIDGLTYLKKLYDENVFGIPADWGEAKYGSNPFKAGKTVMTLGSTAGVANSAPGGNKFEIAAAPVPYRYDNLKFVISQGANLALLDRGTREERVAAWQLIKFLSKYADGAFCTSSGYFPTCPYAEIAGDDGTSGMWAGASDDYQDYATWLTESKYSINMADQIRGQTAQMNISNYVNDEEGWVKFVDAPFSGSADIRNEVASITPWVFGGEKTPKEAIDAIYAKLSSYVRK